MSRRLLSLEFQTRVKSQSAPIVLVWKKQHSLHKPDVVNCSGKMLTRECFPFINLDSYSKETQWLQIGRGVVEFFTNFASKCHHFYCLSKNRTELRRNSVMSFCVFQACIVGFESWRLCLSTKKLELGLNQAAVDFRFIWVRRSTARIPYRKTSCQAFFSQRTTKG